MIRSRHFLPLILATIYDNLSTLTALHTYHCAVTHNFSLHQYRAVKTWNAVPKLR